MSLAQFIVDHGDEFQAYVGTVAEIEELLDRDSTTVVGDIEEGFAVVSDAHLSFLYVPPERRGWGHGRRLLRAAEKLDPDRYLTLACHVSLRPWYSRRGYRVAGADGEMRDMVGPFKSPQEWAEYRAYT